MRHVQNRLASCDQSESHDQRASPGPRASERRVCRVLGQARSTQRYTARPREADGPLVKRMHELVRAHRPRREGVVSMATSDASNQVAPEDACPRCGERDADRLIWRDDDQVECQKCGMVYEPGRGKP